MPSGCLLFKRIELQRILSLLWSNIISSRPREQHPVCAGRDSKRGNDMRTIMFMLLFPSVLSSQSIADAARANRLKKVKITTQRVFTNDDVKHRDSNQEAGVPTDVSKLAAPRQSS